MRRAPHTPLPRSPPGHTGSGPRTRGTPSPARTLHPRPHPRRQPATACPGMIWPDATHRPVTARRARRPVRGLARPPTRHTVNRLRTPARIHCASCTPGCADTHNRNCAPSEPGPPAGPQKVRSARAHSPAHRRAQATCAAPRGALPRQLRSPGPRYASTSPTRTGLRAPTPTRYPSGNGPTPLIRPPPLSTGTGLQRAEKRIPKGVPVKHSSRSPAHQQLARLSRPSRRGEHRYAL